MRATVNVSDRRNKIAEAATSRPPERPPDEVSPPAEPRGHEALGQATTDSVTADADQLWELLGDMLHGQTHEAVKFGSVCYRVGKIDGAEAMLRAVAEAGEAVRVGFAETTRRPTIDELRGRRVVDHRPCLTHCRGCSRCIHADAYQRRGGRDYLGVAREVGGRDE